MRHLKGLIKLFLISLLLTSGHVYARMYQWSDPDTGTTQFSGKPPAWYRGTTGGPRVFVFESGRLIDDTAVDVSDDIRQQMRQQAFIIAEEDRLKASEKIAKAKELKQKYEISAPDQTSLEKSDDLEIDDSEFTEEVILGAQVEEEDQDNVDEKNLEDLRKLISDWEKSQTESAKKALEQ